MSIEIFLLIVLGYLLLVFLMYHLGKGKKIGGTKCALISFFLTPVVGAICFFTSEGKMISLEKRYRCPECKYEFTNPHEYCPTCVSSGKKIELEEVQRNMV